MLLVITTKVNEQFDYERKRLHMYHNTPQHLQEIPLFYLLPNVFVKKAIEFEFNLIFFFLQFLSFYFN